MSRTSVVQIPVDDSEFQKFAEAFEEYQSKLKAMPAEWQAVNIQVAQFARFQQSVGVSADRAWANATRAANDYQRAVQGAAKAQTGLGATIGVATAAMHKMAAASKAVTGNLFSAVQWAIKLGTFGLGGSLFGLGAGLFGLDRLSDTVLATQRSAAGLGLTSGQLNSFRINMARFAGPGVLQGAAEAQIDPRRWGYLAALGIGAQQAQGEDAATLAGQEMLAIRRAWQRNPTLLSAQAQSALQLGFSAEDIRNVGTSNEADLRSAIGASRSDAAQLGWSSQVAREWVAFSIQLHKAGQLIETAFIETLTPLTPDLTRLSGEVAKFIASLGQSDQVKQWIGDLGTGIKTFTDWLGSDAAKRDFQDFLDDIGIIGEAFRLVAQDAAGVATALAAASGDKDAQAKVKSWFAHHPDIAGGAAAGAAAGALAGSFLGPVGIGAGIAVGAGVGALAGAYHDSGPANNPFNMKDSSGNFARFGSKAEGVRQAFLRMRRYPSEYNAVTASQVLKLWKGPQAGPGDMTADQYVNFITERAHIDPNAPLPYDDKQKMAALLHWQSVAEGHAIAEKEIYADLIGLPTNGDSASVLKRLREQTSKAISGSTAPSAQASAQPTGDDLTSVLKRLRKQQQTAQAINVHVYNQTAAMVHVSANAAVAA